MTSPIDPVDATLEVAEKTIAAVRKLRAEELAIKSKQSPLADLPHLLDREGALRLLSCETRAFNRAGKEIGFRKPGKKLLLPTAELLAWIEGQRVEPAERTCETDENAPIPFDRFSAKSRTRKAAV